jgi:hypothetical protein
MSKAITGIVRSFLADAAITKGQIVKRTTTGVNVATADTDKILGVAIIDAAIGDQVSVQLTGTAKVIASTVVAADAYVTATTGGKAVGTTTDKKNIVGIALESGAADGDLMEVFLMQGQTSL